MKRKPLIGINTKLVRENGTTLYTLDRAFVACVERAGGTPVIMPFFRSRKDARAFLERLGGVVFTSGDDPDPRRWGEKKHPKAELLHPERDRSDFLAIGEALRMDLPQLAVCAGCQELNIALGGDIYQHLYDLPGVRKHSEGARHPVAMTGPSRLRDIVGTPRSTVNSYHHQACRTLGKGVLKTAESPDGITEAVESARHRFALGVQWHPERMRDDRRQQALFRALVAEARR